MCGLQSSVYDELTFYTYGQPRVGNAAYAQAFAGLSSEYRVVHYADIVPHLPPELLGFHHVPTEVRVCAVCTVCVYRELWGNVVGSFFGVSARLVFLLCWSMRVVLQ